jgi:dihydrofolate synthase/folylpolyglutamate synthase
MHDPLEHFSGLKSADIRLDLGPITDLLNRFKNPQDAYSTILVGGTNGKGSIAAMVASVLARSGYRVGLYTSPHLIDIRERIRINGEMILPEEMDELIKEIKSFSTGDITYFEFLTAVAFLHFYRKRVDIAVLEVGMGGRLDATNVVSPLISVISNISLEHCEYLGNRLEDIAWEKGGIIKNGANCITAVKQRRVVQCLEEICRLRGAKLIKLGREITIDIHDDGSFSYRGTEKRYNRLFCPLKGRHQIDNAALAVGVIEYVAKKGFDIEENAVYEGIRDVRWEGRLEVLQNAPIVLVDGAHNAAGASVLADALTEGFTYKKLIMVFGVLNDKDYRTMAKKLIPCADHVILTKPASERALSPEAIVPVARQYLHHIDVVENAYEAFEKALSIAAQDDLICVTGSLYLVGEIKRIFAESFDTSHNLN